MSSAAEAELAIERLMEKLEAWVLQQPEALLIWAQGRHARKHAATEIAHIMTRIPTRDNPEMNRAAKRRLIAALEKEDKEWWKGIGL